MSSHISSFNQYIYIYICIYIIYIYIYILCYYIFIMLCVDISVYTYYLYIYYIYVGVCEFAGVCEKNIITTDFTIPSLTFLQSSGKLNIPIIHGMQIYKY